MVGKVLFLSKLQHSLYYHIDLKKMKSRGVLHFCLIQYIYSFVTVRFLPAVPTFAVCNFRLFEAKSADHPGWVVREMYRPVRGIGGAAICGVGTGSAIIGNTEAGSAIIASACVGGSAGRVISRMFS
jgi:hypothetical protein